MKASCRSARPNNMKSSLPSRDGPSLPVVFKRHSCSELTYVHSVGKDMAMKKGRDHRWRTPRLPWLIVSRVASMICGRFLPAVAVVHSALQGL